MWAQAVIAIRLLPPGKQWNLASSEKEMRQLVGEFWVPVVVLDVLKHASQLAEPCGLRGSDNSAAADLHGSEVRGNNVLDGEVGDGHFSDP